MRRFPPPWTVEATDGGFKVCDAGTVSEIGAGMASPYSFSGSVTANPNIAIGCPSPTRADAIAPIASVVPVTAMMMAVVTATIGIVTTMVTAMTTMVTAMVTAMTAVTTMTAMTTMVTTMTAMTAMTTVTMTGERRHGKQHGSRYRANKRELPKHGVSPWFIPDDNVTGAGPVPNGFPVVSANETIPGTMDR
jgi:hypothetical protein